ncbi:MAG: hypothetical protein OEU76_01580 [Cyclobacteriaceae bacterium]|nr:hypothetical protein [Cyclobacteriaceae bacterium]
MNTEKTHLNRNFLLSLGIIVALIISFMVCIQFYNLFVHNEPSLFKVESGVLHINILDF